MKPMSEFPTRVGELRPSQLLWSFGVGAVTDLPNFSAIVLGLDDWQESQSFPLSEPRLLTAVRRVLGRQVERLLAPPIPPTESTYDPFGESARIGVPTMIFPEWLRCPICQMLAPLSSGLFDFKGNPYRPDLCRFVHGSCPRGHQPTAVPARFLVACRAGHLDDFPWVYFVHQGPTSCRGQLKFYEVGASLETANLWVQCSECGKKRSMVEAFDRKRHPLPRCRGRHPHLGTYKSGCTEPLRALLLGASNGWFPVLLSALSIPTRQGKLEQLVEENWAVLEQAKEKGFLEAFRNIGQLQDFVGYSDDEIWKAVETRRAAEDSDEDEGPTNLKKPEWEVFSSPDPALNGPNFKLEVVDVPAPYVDRISSVVLAERLRELNALVGFTRIASPGDLADMGRVSWGPLVSEGRPKWVPANEVRGEGIFVSLNASLLRGWLAGKSVIARSDMLLSGHKRWRAARNLEPADQGFPGVLYTLIHSLSHALMRELSLECGYNPASVRERIYALGPDDDLEMAGLLIYTAVPDSEGTLGGLVSLGRPEELGRLLKLALNRATLCASDPLCCEHVAGKDRTLHGAACHACQFAAETSCENGNKYLDRALLVPTYRSVDSAFFEV